MFFHGYYGIPDDFLPFLDKVDPERRFHGYLPAAPVHVNEGRSSWFDRDREYPPQLEPVAAWLDALPFASGETVLAGWSQGTMVAYALGLGPGRPRPVGIVALGGCLLDEVPPDTTRALPPVAIGHGRNDETVPVERARHARDTLVAAGGEVLYLETDVDHRIDQAVVPELRAFLARLP